MATVALYMHGVARREIALSLQEAIRHQTPPITRHHLHTLYGDDNAMIYHPIIVQPVGLVLKVGGNSLGDAGEVRARHTPASPRGARQGL